MSPSPASNPRAFLRALFEAAVQRALPSSMLAAHLPPSPKGRTLVLGAGKAGGAMAQAVEKAVEAAWPADSPLSGLVITRYEHIPPGYTPRRLEVLQAAHPVPDEAGRLATQCLLALTEGLTKDDLVLCLISGGGSALLSAPLPGVSFEEKRAINQALLMSGAAIGEMNCVRKHLSAVKGGRLAARCAPARVLTLLISDVPGDEPAVIASGPTVPDDSTCADALRIIERYGIALPPAARVGLESGAFETPKPGDVCFHGHETRLIATPRQSLEAAAAMARALGVAAHVLGDDIEGESREVAKVMAALARSVARHDTPFQRPCLLLSGGETTVTVRGTPQGKGGRAGEFMLACALALQGEAGVWGLAADTDGIDGVQANAGALITPDTLARAAALGLNAQTLLDGHATETFFRRLGDEVFTGPTFTNVNDFRALWVA